MTEYKYHYFFTSFDIESFDMEDFKYNFVNITSFRLVDVGDISVRELLKDMERYYFNQNINAFNRTRIIEVRLLRRRCVGQKISIYIYRMDISMLFYQGFYKVDVSKKMLLYSSIALHY